jgi:hypothetical protein
MDGMCACSALASPGILICCSVLANYLSIEHSAMSSAGGHATEGSTQQGIIIWFMITAGFVQYGIVSYAPCAP